MADLVLLLLIAVAIGIQVGLGSRNIHYGIAAATFSFTLLTRLP